MVLASLSGFKVFLLILCALLAVALSPQTALAQKANSEQTKRAIERSENAATVITTITNLNDKGIPKELTNKAQAVAVFPRVVRTRLLLSKTMTGWGVVSRRSQDGWSLPAFYTFGGAGLDLNIVGGDKVNLIMLFMNMKAVDWFEKGRMELKGDRKAVSGPVGSISSDERNAIDSANIVLYALNDGQLAGVSINSNLFKSFSIIPDNKLNKAIYGVKSSELLMGKQIGVKSVPARVDAFQQALSNHFIRK